MTIEREAVPIRRQPSSVLLAIALAWSAIAFAVASALAIKDGIAAGSMIFGAPPLVLSVTCCALVAFGAWVQHPKVPNVVAIVLCAVVGLGAVLSFITPLLVAAVPACVLISVACAQNLGRSRPGEFVAPRSP